MQALIHHRRGSGVEGRKDALYASPEMIKAAARDTAYRSRVGSLFYPFIFLIVVIFGPFFARHPFLTVSIGSVLLLGTVLRAAYVWRFEPLYTRAPRRWFVVSSLGALLQATGWGVLCIVSIHYYGWQWPTMITCLSAAAFSAGVVVTLSPLYALAVTYLVLILSPTLVITLLNAIQESIIAALLFATYIVFLIGVAGRLNGEYWAAMTNAVLLERRARQLERKNQELEAFAYSVSHDLRSPLRAIDGYSQILLEESEPNDSGRQYLQRIRLAAQRMGQIIDDLLRLSKVSNVSYNPIEVNLSQLVSDHLARLKHSEPERDVELDIQPGIHAYADRSLINIAVQNLADNAWKYSRKHVRPKIRFGAKRDGGKTIFFMKSDGAGFDTRYMDKLFKPFHRLHDDPAFPGTGIGLATVHRIIERHNGRIWANAKVDKGATFYFTLSELEH